MAREAPGFPAIMHQSIPAVPIPRATTGNLLTLPVPGVGHSQFYRGPGGWALAYTPGRTPAFDTRVFERQISLSEGRGLCQRLAYQGLEQLVDVFEGMFSQF